VPSLTKSVIPVFCLIDDLFDGLSPHFVAALVPKIVPRFNSQVTVGCAVDWPEK
jgi:hypothetical protein